MYLLMPQACTCAVPGVRFSLPLQRTLLFLLGASVAPPRPFFKSLSHVSLRPHALYSPWDSPGQSTGVGRRFLLQGLFPAQGSNPGLPQCRQVLNQPRYTRGSQVGAVGCGGRSPPSLSEQALFSMAKIRQQPVLQQTWGSLLGPVRQHNMVRVGVGGRAKGAVLWSVAW